MSVFSHPFAQLAAQSAAISRSAAAPAVDPVEAKPRRLLLSIDDVAEAASVSRSFIYAEMTSGRLKYVKVGRLRRIKPADVDAWIAACGQPEE